MQIPFDKYCGDEKMAEYLKKAGAKLSLHDIYGLLHGIIAAPNMVMPSKITTLIFAEEGTNLGSMEEAKELYGNLMGLWNVIAGWNPEIEPFRYPDIEYSDDLEGLKERIHDNTSLIAHFLMGLAMGDTIENDYSEDARIAHELLYETNSLFLKITASLKTIEGEGKQDIQEITAIISRLEESVAECIAEITSGLKEARIRSVEEMRKFSETPHQEHEIKRTKIPRNVPCPCGSGRKFKKCCRLTH